MYIYMIVAFILFVYGAFSTIFHSTDMVGGIGKAYGEANLELFGYLAYIDLIIILYPLYKLYRNRDLLKKIDFYVGWMIFFISLIIFESLVLKFSQVGSVGITLKLFLLPYIGKAGLWLLWLLTFMISLVLIFDEVPNPYVIKDRFIRTKDFIVGYIKKALSKIENPFFDKQSTEVMATIVSQTKDIEEVKRKPKVKTPKKIVHKKKRVSKKVEPKEKVAKR